ESGGKVTVHAEISKPGKVTVTVEDTGIGIDPKTLASLGTRFYRADQARSKDGAGLGLSIVKAICDAHKGAIRFESALSRGTKVFVDLPLVATTPFL
ncbi:MAG TPA: sensor histidine kinase, partial [Candidatus Omnitrophota bacterium]|nr:sensor histidine kinase [Candidatus Omnitrophota bacterium]